MYENTIWIYIKSKDSPEFMVYQHPEHFIKK